nr:trypsin-like serine protease [uncultured Draconibacterium sp.]
MDRRFLSVGNEPVSEIENKVSYTDGSLGKTITKLEDEYVINKITTLYVKDTIKEKLKEINDISLLYPRTKIIIGGTDDRIKVLETEYPYNCIALLLIYDHKGNEYLGTGFFISKRCVITAGHCVYFRGKWAKRIKVIPGAKGLKSPFGEDVSTKFRSVEGWTVSKNANFDYGAIILGNDDLYSNVNCHLGYSLIQDKSRIIELAGYPMDKERTQWRSEGQIKKLSQYRIYYELDTVKGNSGSPIFIRKGNSRIVIGVHSFGQDPNYSIRLNQNILNRWSEWSNL